jgi:hypothetical protein
MPNQSLQPTAGRARCPDFHATSASTLQFTLALVVGGELRFGATLYLLALGIDLISSLLP